MTLTFDWFLPTSGDGHTISGRGHRLVRVPPELRRRGVWAEPAAAPGPALAASGPDVADRELEGAGYGPS